METQLLHEAGVSLIAGTDSGSFDIIPDTSKARDYRSAQLSWRTISSDDLTTHLVHCKILATRLSLPSRSV